jgi:glycosyltransferase involved in cell wall biosynthesis
MKITFATHHFPPNYLAGAEQYAYRISKELLNRGHEVEVICIESISKGGKEPSAEYDVFDGIRTIRLSLDFNQFLDSTVENFRNQSLGKWFYDRLQENRPDILHVNSGYLLSGKVLEVSSQLNIPTVLTLHDYWFMCPRTTLLRSNGKICSEPVPESRCNWCELSTMRRYLFLDLATGYTAGEIVTRLGENPVISDLLGLTAYNRKISDRRQYLRSVLKNVDVVISPSRFLLEKVSQYDLSAKRVIYLPFGYKKSSFAEFPEQTEFSPQVRFGYLGQIVPHKGLHTLIKAFNNLKSSEKNPELLIFGDISNPGAYVENLYRLANDNQSIIFKGQYDNRNIIDVFNQIDVVVVPSEWFENRPTVIIEAFYHKKPVIASNIGGIPELVFHEKNGLLFEQGNSSDLTKQLKRILVENGFINQLKDGIEPVKTIDEEITELEKLYSDAIRLL